MQQLTIRPDATDARTRIALAEQALDRADLTSEQLRVTLANLSDWEEPGDQIDHVIEAWGLWNEIEVDGRDAEEAKEQAYDVLLAGIGELVRDPITVRLEAIEEQMRELAGLTSRTVKAMLGSAQVKESMVEALELALGATRPAAPRGRHLHSVKPPAG